MRWHALILLGAIGAYTALTLTGHDGTLLLGFAAGQLGTGALQAGLDSQKAGPS